MRLSEAQRQQLQARREELVAEGFNPTLVDTALEWAVSSARGTSREDQTAFEQLLPSFLRDAGKYARKMAE